MSKYITSEEIEEIKNCIKKKEPGKSRANIIREIKRYCVDNIVIEKDVVESILCHERGKTQSIMVS